MLRYRNKIADMGIWDFINSTTETVKRNSPDLTHINNACSTTFADGTAAASLVDNAVRVNGLQKVYQYMPDEEARAKIGLFATKFAKNSAVYVLQEGYKLVPGGNAVAKIASKTVHEMKSEDHKGRVMKVSKENRGGVQVHKIGKDQPPSLASDESKKKGLLLMMEEKSAKMEKMQDDINGVKQQNGVSTRCDNGVEPLKELSDEPCEVPAPPEAGRKRVFIRSRL